MVVAVFEGGGAVGGGGGRVGGGGGRLFLFALGDLGFGDYELVLTGLDFTGCFDC